jgi:hypothetical protein
MYASQNINRVIKSRRRMGGSYRTHGTDEKFVQDFNRKK